MRVDTRSGPRPWPNNARRVATGTTTLRTMESMYWWALHWRVHGVWLDVLAPAQCPYESLAPITLHELDWTDQKALGSHFGSMGLGTTSRSTCRFETQLMIVPGYRVRMVCGLVTNFPPAGQHLALFGQSAFVGMDTWKPLYRAVPWVKAIGS